MINYYEIYGLDNRLVWVLILVFQAISMSLATLSIFIPNWVRWIYSEFGLYDCQSCQGSSNYFIFYSTYCSADSGSLCKLIDGLRQGEVAYLVCVCTAVLLTLLWVLFSIPFMIGKTSLILKLWTGGVVLGLLATVSQVTGVAAYVSLTNAVFINCTNNYVPPNQPQICSDDGLNLAFFCAVIYIFTFIIYLAVVYGSIATVKGAQESNLPIAINNGIELQSGQLKNKYSTGSMNQEQP